MVPTARNLLHHDGNSSVKPCYHPGQYCYCVGIAAQLEASAATARQQDHRHRKPSRSPRLAMGDDEPAAAAGGTSSRGGAAAGDWLQLSLAGAAVASSSSASSSGDTNSMDPAPPHMELDLLTTYDKRNARMRPTLFPLPLRSYRPYGRGRYRPAAASVSLSAPSLTFTPSFRTSGDAMRVITPPRRMEAAAGLWLKLQAAPNQVREPILPQIPKSYLRIKDCSSMKVEVVMKYLTEKLGGISASHHQQVELTCRGQLLHPFLLVKHVRDSIWCSTAPPREEEETLAELTASSRRSPAATATTDHVMTLCYSTPRNSKLLLNL